jgi:hypothetical protein
MANPEYNRAVRHFLNLIKIPGAIFIILVVGLALPRLVSIVFVPLPHASASFDCDDAALAMYRHFQSLGIEAMPIIGNLKMDGETYMESNHVWLLVKYGNIEIAYDWGTPRFDRQHYEGYIISLDFLLNAVALDQQNGSTLSSTSE